MNWFSQEDLRQEFVELVRRCYYQKKISEGLVYDLVEADFIKGIEMYLTREEYKRIVGREYREGEGEIEE